MNNLGGKGLQKYPLVRKAKKMLMNLAKSDFAEINGNKMYLGPKDCLNLSLNGIYEPLETEIVQKYVKKGDVVLDVGANIGYYTLMFAKLIGNEGKVFSFEPEPSNFSILKKNVQINNYTNVILENVAVSDTNGEISLYISKERTGMHRIYASHFCSNDSVKVRVIKLDDYFRNNELNDKISFIKMDVEGSEFGVLKGMLSLMEKNQKLKMLLEFVPSCIREFGMKPRDLISLLQKNEFEIYYTTEKNIEHVTDLNSFLEKYDSNMYEKYPKGTNLWCIK